MTVTESVKSKAEERVYEAHAVFNDIRAEVEQGKLHPLDALDQMFNEFTRGEKYYWNKKIRERNRSLKE